MSFLIFPFLSYADINLKIISERKDEKLIQNLKRYIPHFSYKFYPWDSEFAHKVITKLNPDRLPIIIYDGEKLTPQEKENLIKKRIVIKRDKANIFVYISIFLFFIVRAINFKDAFNFINYNVLGIFLGTSILSFLFTNSKVPAYIVSKIEQKKLPVGIIYLLICIVTSFISAFIENVATILIMAPVALEFTRRNNLNPVPLFVGMAISSNLQGCATMVGDSPSIILAMETGMNFNDFFFMPATKLRLPSGKPGIFFFVQFGALLSFFILYLFFRREKGNVEYREEKKSGVYKDTFPTN